MLRSVPDTVILPPDPDPDTGILNLDPDPDTVILNPDPQPLRASFKLSPHFINFNTSNLSKVYQLLYTTYKVTIHDMHDRV